MITRHRVLLVDSTGDRVATLAIPLGHLGHDARIVRTDESARTDLARFRPDLLIVDFPLGRTWIAELENIERQSLYIAVVSDCSSHPAEPFDRMLAWPLGHHELRQLLWHVEVRRSARRGQTPSSARSSI